MSLTPRQARIKLYDHPVIGPGLGFYGTATSISPSALTDVLKLGTGTFAPHTFDRLASVILPNRGGTEKEKTAGLLTVATGVLAPFPATNVWGTYTNEPYEIIWSTGRRRLTYANIAEAQRQAMREVYFLYYAPVGFWKDASGRDNSDFSYGVAEWLPSGTLLSINPDADTAHNISGFSSMLLVNTSGADRYVYHSLGKAVQPGDRYWAAALIKILSGTGAVSVSLWDATVSLAGATQIGQTLTAQGAGSEVHYGQSITIPGNCYRLQMRITLATGVSAAVDALPGHDQNGASLPPPPWITSNSRLHSINEMHHGRDLRQGVQLANTADPRAWRHLIDYKVTNQAEAARPEGVQILRGPGRRFNRAELLPSADLWWAGLRQESDRVDFIDEGDVYNGNEDLYMAALRKHAAIALEARDALGPSGKWTALAHEEQITLDTQRIVYEDDDASVIVEPRRRSLSV